MIGGVIWPPVLAVASTAAAKCALVAEPDHHRDGQRADGHGVGDRGAGDHAEQRRAEDRDLGRPAGEAAGHRRPAEEQLAEADAGGEHAEQHEVEDVGRDHAERACRRCPGWSDRDGRPAATRSRRDGPGCRASTAERRRRATNTSAIIGSGQPMERRVASITSRIRTVPITTSIGAGLPTRKAMSSKIARHVERGRRRRRRTAPSRRAARRPAATSARGRHRSASLLRSAAKTRKIRPSTKARWMPRCVVSRSRPKPAV